MGGFTIFVVIYICFSYNLKLQVDLDSDRKISVQPVMGRERYKLWVFIVVTRLWYIVAQFQGEPPIAIGVDDVNYVCRL